MEISKGPYMATISERPMDYLKVEIPKRPRSSTSRKIKDYFKDEMPKRPRSTASVRPMEYLEIGDFGMPRSNSFDLHHGKTIGKSFDEPPYICRSIKTQGFRQRSDTDPGKYKRPRASALDTLVKHTLNLTSGPLGLPGTSPPTFLAPVQPPSSDIEDASSDIIG